MLKMTLPLGRVKPRDLDVAGVVRLPRTIGVQDGLPVTEDGRVIEVATVVWCTGYLPAFDWVDLDAFDGDGQPVHDRGIAAEPGLYFIGLFFLASAASSLVGGVGRDAEYIARHIAARVPNESPVPVEGLRGHIAKT
jgi:putative flavoprotein involved in K+ transport